MKKLFYLAASAVVVFAGSCCSECGDKCSTEPGFDSVYSRVDADSLASALAMTQGYQENLQLADLSYQMPNFSRDAFLMGIQYVYSADTSASFIKGMQTGIALLGTYRSMHEMSIDVDRATLINSFKKAYLSDSVSQAEFMRARAEFERQYEKYVSLKQSYDSLVVATSEESQENIRTANEYVEGVMANDPAVHSENGIAYKVTALGEGEKVKDGDMVMLNMEARTIDGRIVDVMTPARPVPVSDLVPGLRSGLSMLGKGGSAVLYVPGRLAYGIQAGPRRNLGPNELVIYSVEVADIIPANN